MHGVLSGISTLCGYHQFPSRQKFLTNIDSLFQEAARIPAQIQDKSLHTLPLQLPQSLLQFVASLFAKLNQVHITDFVLAQGKFFLAVNVLDHIHVDR
jgi:hypothetical protein